MKKLLLITLVLLCGALFSTVSAGNPQNIPMQIINEDGVNEGNTKAPPLIIILNDNVLTLPATPVDYTLQLRDANGTVVYSDYIPTGTTQIILPTTLSGSFEIRLSTSTYYYIGYIVL